MQLALARRRPVFAGLTPLIDMIFLLLLFFLVGSDFVPFSQSQIAPPRGGAGDSSATAPVIVTLAADGSMTWNGRAVAADSLRVRAEEVTAGQAETVFVVMPSATANVQQVTDVMDALAEGGASTITLEPDVFDIDLADF